MHAAYALLQAGATRTGGAAAQASAAQPRPCDIGTRSADYRRSPCGHDARGGVVVPPLKENVEERLDKPVALSTIYRMLARNGWRKQAPDKAHAQGGAVAREDWEKNFRRSWTKSSRLGATADRYG